MAEKKAEAKVEQKAAETKGASAEDFARGLRGVVAAQTRISRVEGDIGRLSYCGYDIKDLVEHCTFEEVIYLLWNLELPTKAQFAAFSEKLVAERTLPAGLIYTMRTLPHTTPPMDALRTCVSLLSVYDPEKPEDRSLEANWRRAMRLMAKLPCVVATFERLRKGHEPVDPHPGLSMAGNFMYLMTGQMPDPDAERAMDVGLILHADHGLNASTFAARVTVATLSDVYSGITSAIGALKGPLHGGANQEVLKMLHDIRLMDRVESYIHEKMARKELIMGFGHAVYRNGDPRAAILREWSKRMGERAGDTLWYRMSEKVEAIVTGEKGLKPNVDFYSASVYHTLQIDHDLYTPIFACSRVAGWLAHIMEQYSDNRIIRPLDQWVGAEPRDVVPLGQRD
ncbi:MAG: citrate synthase [Armatimonadetes bacterium]|nr:citrate synthase [Armatimonadota bacterium]